MTFNKFMSIFKLFIDEDTQDNKIEINSYTIHYNKPSILDARDTLSYYRGDLYLGYDYIDRGGIRDINGNLIFHSKYGVLNSSYEVNGLEDFESFEEYLDYKYEEYIKNI